MHQTRHVALIRTLASLLRRTTPMKTNPTNRHRILLHLVYSNAAALLPSPTHGGGGMKKKKNLSEKKEGL